MSNTRYSDTRDSNTRPLPLETDAGSHSPLGMSAARFLRDYWQKRPLLIRNAFPGFESPLQPEDLAGLACEDGVLARIISHDRGDPIGSRDTWTVRSGPFREEEFPDMPDHDWTLLVQDMDKWDPDVRALLDAFDFLPRWRLDDIMISFAAPGGSVGAHVDQYDVFLLQGLGHRRWQIDASLALGKSAPPSAFRDDVELKLLREFHPTHDWVLGPGDMLYLPPGVPHHGVAEDACLTFSVGMRAPSAAELLGDFVDTLAADADESLRYCDDDLAPPQDPNEIDEAAIGRAIAGLNALRMNDPERLGDWFGRFMTLYRSVGDALTPDPPRSRIEIEWDLQQGAMLERHPWTRVAWRRCAGQSDNLRPALAKAAKSPSKSASKSAAKSQAKSSAKSADKSTSRAKAMEAALYLAGQIHYLPINDARLIAASATLDGECYAALSVEAQDLIHAWIAQGHYRLNLGNDDAP